MCVVCHGYGGMGGGMHGMHAEQSQVGWCNGGTFPECKVIH